MTEYRLLTIWRLEAPLEKVYAAVENSLHWPRWWPGVQKVEQLASGDAHGIDSVRRYWWQGQLPYRLVFDVRATRIEQQVAIEGDARGDLDGVGRWHFSRQDGISVVRYEWHVRGGRWWMQLLAPLARPLFIRNHALLMAQGGEGLARLLGSRLLSQENIDLLDAVPAPRGAGHDRSAEAGTRQAGILLIAGALYGLAVCLLALCGLALPLAWLPTPLVFGVALAGGCRLLAENT